MKTVSRPLLRVSKTILVIMMALASLVPFYILLLIALSSPAWNFSARVSLIPEFLYRNFIESWLTSAMGRSIINSLAITSGALAIVILTASAAGYAIARFPNRFHRTVLNVFLFCMMIPPIINTVPLYTLMRSIGGINSRLAMAFVCGANTLPFSVFLYASFLRSLTREIEESAIIDGCTWFSAFWRVTFPLLKPMTAAIIIINGLGIWNNYAQAIFFLQSSSVRTIPLAVSIFYQQYGAKWHLMAAAAAIGMMPVVFAFLLTQKYFIKGLSAGAIKG